jgi:anti-anti-sigma factor
VTDEIVVQRDGASVAILELVGEHDGYSARKIGTTIKSLFGEGRDVVVDLRRTTFLDSTTVSQLLVANGTARERRLGFAVVVGGTSGWPVRTMFEVAHLDEVLAIEPTPDRAIERIREREAERRSGRDRRAGLERRRGGAGAPAVERRSPQERRSGADRRAP